MSVYTNRFQVNVYQHTTRIIFEDCVVGKEGIPVANVVMEISTAEDLVKVLNRLLLERKGNASGDAKS